MKQRVITAVLSFLVFVPIVYTGSWLLEITVALLGIISLFELFRMKGNALFSIEGIIAIIGLLLILLPSERLPWLTAIYSTDILFYICGLLLLAATVFSKNKFTFDDAACTLGMDLNILYSYVQKV